MNHTLNTAYSNQERPMKANATRWLIGFFAVVWVACEIVDPFLVALNLPLEVCAEINEGNSWDESGTYNIHDEIANVSEDYVDDVQATRVNDITVFMPNPPATGDATGSVRFSLDGGPLTTLLTFTNLPFDSLRGDGLSFRDYLNNPSGQLQFNIAGVNIILTALQDSTGLPATSTIYLESNGTTSVDVPQGTNICAKISYQVDVEISN